MNILFDGDLLVHRMCAACQEMSPFDKTLLIKADPEDTWNCIQLRVEQCVYQVMEHFDLYKDDIELTMCFSSPVNYRKEVNPEYKSNRKGVAKPVLFRDMVDKAKRLYQYEEWHNIEADDIMGIMQDANTIICTGDKDLLQIPGFHLNMLDPESGVFSVSEAEGRHLFYTQCLSGDTVDGYYGCPQIGKTKANRIVEDAGNDIWDTICEVYRSAMSPKTCTVTLDSGAKRVKKLKSVNLGLGAKEALMTARMAYILRYKEDYNKETGEVRLWNP